jgi:hypothetical protein
MSKTVPYNTIEYTKKDGKLIKYLLDLAVLYAQALSEIKDIAKDTLEYFHDSDTGSIYDKIELILQKCEVLDEDSN